jgi:hypothetical protein
MKIGQKLGVGKMFDAGRKTEIYAAMSAEEKAEYDALQKKVEKMSLYEPKDIYQKTKAVMIRLSKADYDEVCGRAKEAKLKPSEFMRRAVLEFAPTSKE